MSSKKYLYIGFISSLFLTLLFIIYIVVMIKNSSLDYFPVPNSQLRGFLKWVLSWIILLDVVIFVAYANYRWVFRKLFFTRNTRFIFISWMVLLTWATFELFQLRTGNEPGLIIENLIVTLVVMAFLVVFIIIADLLEVKKQKQILEKERIDAQLQTLKNQVNPHFLFNALNTIYSQTLVDQSEKSAQLIQKLSGILRFTLLQSQLDKITLKKEIEFLQMVIDLHKERLTTQTRELIKFDVNIEYEEIQLAPMLFSPFIENAFKYGLNNSSPQPIEIYLGYSNQVLEFNISNHVFEHLQKSNKGTGNGIKNVKERLALEYPNSHVLEIKQHNKFEVVLKLTCEKVL